MIVGVGVELVELPRFRAALERFGERLLERLFTDAERDYAGGGSRAPESLAARFAAKVAARRALGGQTCLLREIEVLRERGGAPRLRFHGAAERAAAAGGVLHAALSLTHDASWCIGHVVLEGRP